LAAKPNRGTISREQLGSGWPSRPHRGLVAEIVRRRADGVGPIGGSNKDVAVLHAGMKHDVVAAQLRLQRGDHFRGGFRRRMTAGEVHHRAVMTDGHEVAPIRHLVGPQLQSEGRRFDRRTTGVVRRGVIADDRHVADIRPWRQARRYHRGPPDLTPRRQR